MLFCESQGLKDLFFYRRESAYQCTPTTGYSWACAGGKIFTLTIWAEICPQVFCLTEAMRKLTLQINLSELNEIENQKRFSCNKEAKKAKFDFKKKFEVILN